MLKLHKKIIVKYQDWEKNYYYQNYTNIRTGKKILISKLHRKILLKYQDWKKILILKLHKKISRLEKHLYQITQISGFGATKLENLLKSENILK